MEPVAGSSSFNLDINADIRSASTLPAWAYRDRAFFEFCRERIFARSWQIVGDLNQVKTPQSACPVIFLPGMVDEPLLLTRDADDQVRCMSNVCTHRGNLVVHEPCSTSTLRCAYHGRRFSLDGCMLSMPEFEEASDFPSSRDNLPQVQHRTLGPLVFASIDPAMSFDDLISDVLARVGWLPLDEFVFDPARSRDYLVQANWMLYCDNYLEGFHIPFVHASLNDALDYGEYATETFRYSNLQLGVSKGGEHVFDLPADSPDAGREIAGYYFWLFPNLMLNFYPWGMSVNIVKPLAVNRTRVSFLSYVWDEAKLDDGAGAALDRVEREDEVVVEAVQKGIESRLYNRGRYSPTREQCVHHFHRLLAKFAGGSMGSGG